MGFPDEIVAIVDQENRVVGSATRRRVRAERLPHRCAYIFVFNSRGELFVQQRTHTKDVYPGYFDAAAGGVVLSEESYDECARRELAEELGITGVPLDRLFDFYFEDEQVRVFGEAFVCRYDGAISLQAEEIQSGRFMNPVEVVEERFRPITPDSLHALRRYLSVQGCCNGGP